MNFLPVSKQMELIRRGVEEILPEEPQSFSIYGEFKQGV